MGEAILTAGLRQAGMAFIAIGIIGATVMPHNLYLHSALVQSRKIPAEPEGVKTAIRYNTIDSTVALSLAFLVNAAILVLAAQVFFGRQSVAVAGGSVVHFGPNADWIQVAFLTLAPLLGTAAASILFAVALLASGQSSTITGTLAGQVVMEGFMRWRISPWVRRLSTRLLAIIPAVVIIGTRGSGSVNDLLILSQVVLSLRPALRDVPAAPVRRLEEADRTVAQRLVLLATGWTSALLTTAMDVSGLPESLRAVWHIVAGG